MKKVFFIVALCVIFAYPASAQDSGSATRTPTRPQNLIDQVKTERDQAKEDIKDTRKQNRDELEASREEMKKKLQETRDTFQEKIKENKELLRTKLQEKKDTLKERVKKFKDTRKQEILLRLNDQLDILNDRMVQHFTSVLSKLELITNRISDRASKLSENGADTSSVLDALKTASEAIATARTAVTVQAGKTYTITVSTETKLATDVGKVRQLLREDLKKVKESIDSARTAVRKAAQALTSLIDSRSPSASTSATPTATATPEANQ